MNEVAKDVENALEGLPIDSITAAIGQALLASNVKRIHQEGKDVNNNEIGQYSTDDILVGQKSFIQKAKWDALYKKNTKKISKKAKKDAEWGRAVLSGIDTTEEKYLTRYKKLAEKDQRYWRTIKRGSKTYRLILLKGGYKELRRMQGRESKFVNLNYSGKLQADFDLVVSGNEAELGFFTDYGARISKSMEAKYKRTIWGATKKDEKDISAIVREIVTDYIKRKI